MPLQKWDNNFIQFPRLLAEINACGLNKSQMKFLRESMDLSNEEIESLLFRAEVEFEHLKHGGNPRRQSPKSEITELAKEHS